MRNDDERFRGMTETQFRKLLELSTSDTYFIFNEKYYKQKEGLAMGSPLSATLANIFLCYHEKKWLNLNPYTIKDTWMVRLSSSIGRRVQRNS